MSSRAIGPASLPSSILQPLPRLAPAIVRVSHRLEPFRLRVDVDGNVDTARAGRGAVPVLLARRDDDSVAVGRVRGGLALALDPDAALEHEEPLRPPCMCQFVRAPSSNSTRSTLEPMRLGLTMRAASSSPDPQTTWRRQLERLSQPFGKILILIPDPDPDPRSPIPDPRSRSLCREPYTIPHAQHHSSRRRSSVAALVVALSVSVLAQGNWQIPEGAAAEKSPLKPAPRCAESARGARRISVPEVPRRGREGRRPGL